MKVFFPDQRWTSKGEPELGVGVVVEASHGRVRLFFPSVGEYRMYSEENAPLHRAIFKKGDTIVDKDGKSMVIESARHEGMLMDYMGENRIIPEAELGDMTVHYGVMDKLLMGDLSTTSAFYLRWQTLANDHKRRISPLRGFLGGRVDLIPHQFYIAHKVSTLFKPRVLLSDQVGLGKTIEACLILHHLLLSGRISRALILVPEPLVYQWFVELFRRFNLWFSIFDEDRCKAVESGAPEGNPFLENQLILCSISFITSSADRAAQAISAGWDMLVVDEAHHLQWSERKASRPYEVVSLLSQSSHGLLLLTATPEQLGMESHFARLHLLDPERYSDYDAFRRETRHYRQIADIIEALSAQQHLSADQKQLLLTIFDKHTVDQAMQGSINSNRKLIDELLDLHGAGRSVFRNTRSAMRGFPQRQVHLQPLTVSVEQEMLMKQVRNEFENDATSNSPAVVSFDFLNDPRTQWLIALLQQLSPAKVLLICNSREKVLALHQALTKTGLSKLTVFHEDLTIIQRDRHAAWFSEPSGAQILLCSEIGSEGRNFQFAQHLVMFDLPLHPELLEQRIGRLDRIGQSGTINIYVPYLIGSPQQMLARWYHEGLNAFESHLEGGNEIIQAFRDRLLEICSNATKKNTKSKMKSLIGDTVVYRKQLMATLARGKDRLLEMNSYKPKIAQKLVDQIQSEDQNRHLESYMTAVFEHFGIETEDLARRTYRVHRPPTDAPVFPAIPDEGLTITFDRKQAVVREDIAFISWDHPVVTGAIDMILSLDVGSTGFGVIHGANRNELLLEAIFVVEAAKVAKAHADRYLPPTPIRMVVNDAGEEKTKEFDFDTLHRKVTPANPHKLLESQHLRDTVLPEMMKTATYGAEKIRKSLIEKALNTMNLLFDGEIERLNKLQEKNKGIASEEILAAKREQSALQSIIKNATLRPDALRIIHKKVKSP
jgi:ATP-dependent helicase HepA